MPVSSDLTLIQLFEVLSDTAQLSFLRRCLPNQAYKRQQTSRSCRRHPDRMRIFTTKNICDSTAAQSRSTRRSRAASAGSGYEPAIRVVRSKRPVTNHVVAVAFGLSITMSLQNLRQLRTLDQAGQTMTAIASALVASHAQRIELTAEVAEHDCPVAGHSGLGLPLFTSLPD